MLNTQYQAVNVKISGITQTLKGHHVKMMPSWDAHKEQNSGQKQAKLDNSLRASTQDNIPAAVELKVSLNNLTFLY